MSLEKILNPRSVAVVGASRNENKRGFQALKALCGGAFEGQVFPVNPHIESILGRPCWPSLTEIGSVPDLALITTSAVTVPEILEECGRVGVAGAVIIAGGFGELGGDGRCLQDSIVAISRRTNVRIVGPNTNGIINVHSGLNLVGIGHVPAGDIALLSQSGNMALHLITEAQLKTQRGFSYYVGVGNEADIAFHEYLEFFTDDPKTNAIVMYVEGMREGRSFLQQAYRTSRVKPIIVLKGGRSAKGSQSVGSHTGALAGISEVSRTAFQRAGITVVERSDELFPVTEAVSSLPPITNDRIAILADGGGHATVAADVLTDRGVMIPSLAKTTRAELSRVLSPTASLANPVDVAGSTDSDPGVFADCARILLSNKQIGGLLLVGLFGGYGIRFADRLQFIEEDAAHRMGKLVRELGKPIVVHSLYRFAKPHALDLLRYYGIPVFDSLEQACSCIAALAGYGHVLGNYKRRTSFVFNWGARARDRGRALIASAAREGRLSLFEHEAKALLELHGAPVSVDKLARTADEAVAIAEELGGPVALKLCSPDILHKTDAGGVRLALATSAAVAEAFSDIVGSARRFREQAEIRGCIVSPMAGPGTEVIIGTKIDAQFGPVIMFGAGGIMVEVLKDVVFRVLPISRRAAREMISEVRSAPILKGFRGQQPVDVEVLARLLLTVSEVVESYPEIQEMDLNPVITRADGLTVVDARIILKKG